MIACTVENATRAALLESSKIILKLAPHRGVILVGPKTSKVLVTGRLNPNILVFFPEITLPHRE